MKHLKLFETFSNTNEGFVYSVLQGYLEAALWTSELDSYSISDIDEESSENARKDIDNFLDKLETLELLYPLKDKMEPESIGHDFWLTRNGHGAGFWDRDLDELGDAVTKVCKEFPTLYVYEEDKVIYID